MVIVTEELILRIHRSVILSGKSVEVGLCDSILDEGAIPAICLGAQDILDPIEKSAYFLQRISTRHPFFEGNKRTSFIVADMILRCELGYTIAEDEGVNYDFVKSVINDGLSINVIAEWILGHIIRLSV